MNSLGRQIAEGRQAEIYRWGKTQVVKLYRNAVSLDVAEYEASITRAVHATGLPVPAVGEIVTVEDRVGLVYEFVDGRSVGDHILANPWTIGRYARLLAELQADLHDICSPPELPSHHERLRDRLHRPSALSSRIRQAALKVLDHLPDGEVLCHGDFNVNNILMTAGGPIIVDWDSAARCDPVADIAWTWIQWATGTVPWWASPFRSWSCMTYRRRCLQLHQVDPDHLRLWTAVGAAARICEGEGIRGQEQWALSLAEKILFS